MNGGGPWNLCLLLRGCVRDSTGKRQDGVCTLDPFKLAPVLSAAEGTGLWALPHLHPICVLGAGPLLLTLTVLLILFSLAEP